MEFQSFFSLEDVTITDQFTKVFEIYCIHSHKVCLKALIVPVRAMDNEFGTVTAPKHRATFSLILMKKISLILMKNFININGFHFININEIS